MRLRTSTLELHLVQYYSTVNVHKDAFQNWLLMLISPSNMCKFADENSPHELNLRMSAVREMESFERQTNALLWLVISWDLLPIRGARPALSFNRRRSV